MTIYRLFQARFAPWDATGAKKYGGRWNNPGREMLYASSSLSLACLEVVVHIRDVYNVPEFSYCSIDVKPDLVSAWPYTNPADVARGRAILDSDVLSREFGDGFLVGGSMAELPLASPVQRFGEPGSRDAAVQAVPSVVVPEEMNYLLNPSHEEFNSMKWSAPKLFQFDPRLLDAALR